MTSGSRGGSARGGLGRRWGRAWPRGQRCTARATDPHRRALSGAEGAAERGGSGRARSGSIARRQARAREKKREGVVAAGARRTTEFDSGRRDGDWLGAALRAAATTSWTKRR